MSAAAFEEGLLGMLYCKMRYFIFQTKPNM